MKAEAFRGYFLRAISFSDSTDRRTARKNRREKVAKIIASNQLIAAIHTKINEMTSSVICKLTAVAAMAMIKVTRNCTVISSYCSN
jgi:hypothetical protein